MITHRMKIMGRKSGEDMRYIGFQNGRTWWKAPRISRYYFIGGYSNKEQIAQQLMAQACFENDHSENGFYG